VVLTGLLGRSLRPRVRLPFGLPLVPRRAPRVAELVLCALRFAVEVVGPVVTTVPLSCYIYLPLHVNGELKFVQT
jgi:hypothetical protein